jgi:hypothetical protein
MHRRPHPASRILLAVPALCFSLAIGFASPAVADTVAYLVNVTVRPGYNFPNADAAVGYGQGICEKIALGRTYGQIVSDVRADFNTADQFQASYLISQASNELCPALIWQLRNSAAYEVPAP